jgi:SagB-type dehydrogenase family enzyme
MTHARDKKLDDFLEPIGFESPELAEIDAFHERTKIYPYQIGALARRLNEYMGSARGHLEATRNFKSYPLSSRLALPPASFSDRTLASTLAERRSIRLFAQRAISLEQLASVLSGARVRGRLQIGETPELAVGLRAYPSGGALYPVETYVITLHVQDIGQRICYYHPHTHALEAVDECPNLDDIRSAFVWGDDYIENAAALLLYSACFERSVVKYGFRGYRYALMEVGMASFTASLIATNIGLGTLHCASFFDEALSQLLGIDGVHEAIVSAVFVGYEA